jgi:hypothetical protein
MPQRKIAQVVAVGKSRFRQWIRGISLHLLRKPYTKQTLHISSASEFWSNSAVLSSLSLGALGPMMRLLVPQRLRTPERLGKSCDVQEPSRLGGRRGDWSTRRKPPPRHPAPH